MARDESFSLFAQRKRAERAEAEVERLRETLREIQAHAVASRGAVNTAYLLARINPALSPKPEGDE